MLLTNEKVPKVPLKTTTMHDYFKLADGKKAVDDKQGHCLKKQKSIANESIDIDREDQVRHITMLPTILPEDLPRS
jgi:hypothetical protein